MTQSDCRKSRRERSPFTITGHRTDLAVDRGFSLSLRPHRWPPGRKPSIRRACSTPSNLQSTIHTSRVGRGVEAGTIFRNSAQHGGNQITILCSTATSAPTVSAQYATAARVLVRQMSAAVMLPVAHKGYGPAVQRLAEAVVEGVWKRDDVTSVSTVTV